ncbi:hypothetical protein [Enterococcus sp. BWR-S5]|uniref:hypothetical protein n=1 Tax=Enterococcus sp. BWR-S5 TaxID=2787714 RepID=UPI0019237682|nr:hypothetical protein [Enterococcus sp. BWR-S5]MBL1224163.1 hypothetical protein [Enterococcus sp. BWR-S5]
MKNRVRLLLLGITILMMVGCEKTDMDIKGGSMETNQTVNQETSWTYSGIDGRTILPKSVIRDEFGDSLEDNNSLPASNGSKEVDKVWLAIVRIDDAIIKTPTENKDFYVDLKSKKIFLYPMLDSIKTYEPEWGIDEKAVNNIQRIIEKYEVDKWQELYGEKWSEEREGADEVDLSAQKYWEVLLVYKDNTISKHEGYGESKPEQFDGFHQELMDFQEEQREKWRATIEE